MTWHELCFVNRRMRRWWWWSRIDKILKVRFITSHYLQACVLNNLVRLPLFYILGNSLYISAREKQSIVKSHSLIIQCGSDSLVFCGASKYKIFVSRIFKRIIYIPIWLYLCLSFTITYVYHIIIMYILRANPFHE